MDMSKHLSRGQLLAYAFPAMLMMLFTSIYGIVDGLFISNFAGKTAFAAVNLIMPFISILATLGYMMGSGGNALISKTRGQGNDALANEYFSLIVYFTLAAGVVIAVLGAAFMEPVARALGASDDMLGYCVLYGRICMVSLPAYLLQYAFQTFTATAGKPKLGLAVTVIAGVANMVLDFLFVAVMGWGVAGAAVATAVSEYLGGFIPLVYFARPNGSFLRLGKPHKGLRTLGGVCVNGSSEMMTSVAMSVVGIVYNLQLMRLLGEDGVAAYGAIMYVAWFFGALISGYCMGTAPIMSFQHGAENDAEKRSIMRNSIAIVLVGGIGAAVLVQVIAQPVAALFTSYDAQLEALTVHGMRLYCLAFALMGFSMYGSSLFTALGNGPVSAAIAFLRTLVFEIGSVILLPMLIGSDGIWLSVGVAEVFSVCLTAAFIWKLGPRYGIVRKRAGKGKGAGAVGKGARGRKEARAGKQERAKADC